MIQSRFLIVNSRKYPQAGDMIHLKNKDNTLKGLTDNCHKGYEMLTSIRFNNIHQKIGANYAF